MEKKNPRPAGTANAPTPPEPSGSIVNVLATLESLRLDFEQNSGGGAAAAKSTPEKKKKKKRERTKPKKRVEQEQPVPESVRKDLLTEENVFILQLLSMDHEEREQHLLQMAVGRDLLTIQGRGSRSRLEINPYIYGSLLTNRQNGELVKLHKLREAINPRHQGGRKRQEASKETSEGEKKSKKSKRSPLELSEIEEKYLKVVEAEAGGPGKPLPVMRLNRALRSFAEEFVKENRGEVVEGEIRVSAVNYHNAYMANPNGGKDIIFRSSVLRQHALPGDQVLALIFKTTVQEVKADTTLEENPEESEEDKEPEKLPEESPVERVVGVVLEILEEKHNRLIVGTFDRPFGHQNLLTPRDNRLPRIRIANNDMIRGMSRNSKMMMSFIFLAKVTHASLTDVSGRLLKIVGQIGELESENRAILLANDLNPEPYPEALLAELPSFDVQPKDFPGREDLRTNTCIFTIDPATARDLDDAMSCVKIDENTFEVGVHIADVAHFIPEDSPLDMILRKKTTSIYLVNAVYHMLPLPMCLNCSLLPGKDRLAFSVFWRMDKDGNVLEERITKSVINSCVQLAYSHAQLVIDKEEKELKEEMFPKVANEYFSLKEVLDCVRHLHGLSRKLRRKRFDNGAVKLDQPKIGFILNPDSGLPTEYYCEVMQESNQLIEEFMLLANMTVAKWIHRKFPATAVLRCHEQPDRNQFEKLTNELKTVGVPFDLSSTLKISESLEKVIEESKDKEAAKVVLTCMLTKPMMRARYFCSGMTESEEEFQHYFLSIPIYTHFTSPIRRYPDILVHRLLAAAVCGAEEPGLFPEVVHKIAGVCNAQKYNAKLASNDSINLYFLKYVESMERLKMRAAVYKIGLSFIEVILIETNHHVKVTYGGGKASFVENVTPKTVEVVRKTKDDVVTKRTISVFSECQVAVTCRKGKLSGKLIWDGKT